MIGLEEIWVNILCNEKINNTKFDAYFLMQLGEILARDGFHGARIFLWDSQKESGLRRQAKAIAPIIKDDGT